MKRNTGSSFFAKTDKQISEIGQTHRALATKKSMYCKEDRKIEDCKHFVDLTLRDRISFTVRNRLCDNCFKRGHIAGFCRVNNSKSWLVVQHLRIALSKVFISFEAFHLILIKKDRQNGEHRKSRVFIQGAELRLADNQWA